MPVLAHPPRPIFIVPSRCPQPVEQCQCYSSFDDAQQTPPETGLANPLIVAPPCFCLWSCSFYFGPCLVSSLILGFLASQHATLRHLTPPPSTYFIISTGLDISSRRAIASLSPPVNVSTDPVALLDYPLLWIRPRPPAWSQQRVPVPIPPSEKNDQLLLRGRLARRFPELRSRGGTGTSPPCTKLPGPQP